MGTGHRARQKDRVLNSGGYVLTDRELLEMLLYYVLPRIDTKPIADELLAKFGSIKGVLDADGGSLSQVKGIKENAEVFFLLLRQVSLRDAGAVGKGDLRDGKTATEFLLRVFEGVRSESVFAAYLGENGELLDSEFVFRGDISSARFPMRAVTEGVIRCRGRSVVIAHNHPSGSVIPSSDDIATTKRMAVHLAANDINLIEHYIVGAGECAGILEKSVINNGEVL